MPWKWIVLVPLFVVAGGVVTLALLSFFSRKPDNLGVHDGRLSPCLATPNCVCSQDDDAQHAVAPLTFEGEPAAAWERLRAVVAAMPRTAIVTATDDYLHAESTSLVFRFVDDLEFQLDLARRVIHVRSASRAGRSDLGVNRARVEEVRRAWEATPKP